MSEQMGLRFRDPSIDLYRGLAIIGMVLTNFLVGVQGIPPFLRNTRDIGFSVIDIIAPMFVFAMGLSLGPSINRRVEREGLQSAYDHMLRRSLSFIGIGAVLDAALEFVTPNTSGAGWGLLQALGLASLSLMLVIRFPRWGRIIIGYGLLGIYGIGSALGLSNIVILESNGGFYGAIGWAAMLILMEIGVSYMEITFDDNARIRPPKALLRACIHYAVLLGAGLLLSRFIPISKNRVSVSYILTASGICGYLYIVIVFFIEYSKLRFHRIESWGKNPLMIYLAHTFLLAFFVLPPIPGWYREAAPFLTIVQIVVFFSILHTLARFLSRRGIILHI